MSSTEKDGISYSISQCKFTVSACGNETLMHITNISEGPIIFLNEEHIDIKNVPGIKEIVDKKVAAFFVFFHYGEESESLATVENAKKMEIDIVNRPDWKILKIKDRAEDAPDVCWVVSPPKTVVLEQRACISLKIHDVCCNGAVGVPGIYFMLRFDFNEQADYVVRSEGIEKIAQPVITKFEAVGDYKKDGYMKLMWDVRHDEGGVSVDGKRMEKGVKEVTVTASDKPNKLDVKNAAEFCKSSIFKNKFFFIKKFEFSEFYSADKVIINWETADTTGRNIEYISENIKECGSLNYDIYEDREFNLNVTEEHEIGIIRKHSQILSFKKPVIKEFYVSSKIIFNLMENTDFITLEEMEEYETIHVLIVPYEGPGPGPGPEPPSPPPPEPKKKIYAKWQTENAAGCKLQNKNYDANSDLIEVSVNESDKIITLEAYTAYGYYVSKTVNIN